MYFIIHLALIFDTVDTLILRQYYRFDKGGVAQLVRAEES